MPKGSDAHRQFGKLRKGYSNEETPLEDFDIKSIKKINLKRQRLAMMMNGYEIEHDDRMVVKDGFVQPTNNIKAKFVVNKYVKKQIYGIIHKKMVKIYGSEERADDAMRCMLVNFKKGLPTPKLDKLTDEAITEHQEAVVRKTAQYDDDVRERKYRLIGIEENPGPDIPDTFRKELGHVNPQAKNTNTYKGRIDKLFKKETHLNGFAGKYNFTGPGTKLDKRIVNGKVLTPPINKIDEISMKHDLAYGRNKNQDRADRNMLNELSKFKPKTWRESADRKIVATAIQTKMKLDGDYFKNDRLRIAKIKYEKPGMKEGIEENPGPKKFVKQVENKIAKKVARKMVGPLNKNGKFNSRYKKSRPPRRGRGGRRGGMGGFRGMKRREKIGMQVNSKVSNFRPKFRLRTAKDGSILLEGHEVLQTGISFSTSQTPGTPLLNTVNNSNQQYAPIILNPAALGLPRLAKIASCFEKFVFVYFKVILQTGLPTSTAGAVCGFFDPDVEDSFSAQQPAQIYTTAISHKKAKQFSVWEPYMSWINPFKKRKINGSVLDGYYVDADNHTVDTRTQANFWLLSSIAPTNNISNCGNVLIEYTCKLWDPTSDPQNAPVPTANNLTWCAIRNNISQTGTNSLAFPVSNIASNYFQIGTNLVSFVPSVGSWYDIALQYSGNWYIYTEQTGVALTNTTLISATASYFALNISNPYGIDNSANTGTVAIWKVVVPSGVVPGSQNARITIGSTTTTLARTQIFFLYCGSNDLNSSPTLRDLFKKGSKKLTLEEKIDKMIDRIEEIDEKHHKSVEPDYDDLSYVLDNKFIEEKMLIQKEQEMKQEERKDEKKEIIKIKTPKSTPVTTPKSQWFPGKG